MSKKRSVVDEAVKIRGQLKEADPAAGGLAYDLRWAARTLAGEEVAPPEVLAEELLLALTEELAERKRGDTLTRLASSSHRSVAKAARTGLHRLRSHKVGVDVPVPAPEPHTGTGLLAVSTTRGLVTMYDGRGERAIWLAAPSAKGIYLHQGRISAANGLLDFETYSSTRRKFRKLVEQVRTRMVAEYVETAVAHWFIEEAAQRGQRAQRGLPEGYAAASQLLGPPPEGEHPALGITAAAVSDETLLDLFQERALGSWLPESDFVRRVLLRLQEVATSRLLVSASQGTEQLSAVLGRAVEEYHTAQRCATARRILLDTAHLFAAGGCGDKAALARAAADVYEGPRGQVVTHPFLRRFIERALPAQPRGGGPPPEAKTTEGGLIMPGR
jgi:hypothetical protein